MKKYEINMCEGSIAKSLFRFSIPLILSNILQLLFNAADIIVVGRFDGSTSLAAVGSTGPLVNLLINIFIGYSTGASVIISQYFGSKNSLGTKRAVSTTAAMSLIFGIIISILGILFSEKMLIMMGSPTDVLPKATKYLSIYFLGSPALIMYNFLSCILRAVGDTKRPMYFLSFAGIVNVILNLITVVFLKMGVSGVAIATVISQYVSFILVLVCLKKTDADYKLDLKNIRFHKTEFIKITQIGLPAGIQGSVFSFSNIIIQAAVNSFGSVTVAGNSAGSNIDGFIYAIIAAFSQAVLTFTSQNFGAGKLKRIKKGIVTSNILEFSIVFIFAIIVVFFSKSLMSIYSTDSAVIAIGIERLSILCISYCLCGIMDNFASTLRGLSVSFIPMISTILGVCGFRILYIFTVFPVIKTLPSLYASYPISWFATSVIHLVSIYIVFRKFLTKYKQQTQVS